MTYNGTVDNSVSYASYDWKLKEKLIYVNVGILFRSFGDTF